MSSPLRSLLKFQESGLLLVILRGGIDLSVGAIYALASVLGALVLHHYGPDGAAASGLGVWLGIGACVGTAALCGLVNGGLIVALRVHPFIITLGAMAILRGIAFVATKGQSIGGFPPALQEFVRQETGDGLSPGPMPGMFVVPALGLVFLSRLAAGGRFFALVG